MNIVSSAFFYHYFHIEINVKLSKKYGSQSSKKIVDVGKFWRLNCFWGKLVRCVDGINRINIVVIHRDKVSL